MKDVKIANLLISDQGQFSSHPSLLIRSDAPFLAEGDGWRLLAGHTYDFTTYFNALSVAKYKLYTSAQAFKLQLEISGGAFEYAQAYGARFSQSPVLLEETRQLVKASRAKKTHTFDLTADASFVVIGFSITPSKDVVLHSGAYFASVEAKDVRKVHLALCTTTFKKEQYVQRNIENVRTQIITDPEITKNFTMHVVDNGRTLDAKELSHDGVQVHPNPNVGGSGGFARGMMEALKQKLVATHVLLMDDDVVVSPESIKRTYYLLCILNEQYKDAFLSGGMMHISEPNYFFEDAGFVHGEGYFCAGKPQYYMDIFHNIIAAETIPLPRPYPTQPYTNESYAAWWYCVIPVSAIEEHGLPLPFFVRSDDVEYSRRVNPLIMTLNGIVVWHEAFDARYAPAQERYQMPRNILILQSIHPDRVTADFQGHIKRQFFLELRKYNYTDAKLMLEGIEDYLKGPEYFGGKGVTEQRFMDALKNSEKLVDLESLREECADLGVNIDDIFEDYLLYEPSMGTKDKTLMKLSDNGQKLFNLKPFEKSVEIIDSFGFSYPRYRIFGTDALVCVDRKNAKGIVRHKDKKQYKELVKRYKRDMKALKKNRAKLDKAYQDAFQYFITEDFWNEYLGL